MTTGDWPYGEDKYQRYVAENQGTLLTEDPFRSAVAHHNQAWTDTSVLKSAVLDVLAVLLKLPETSWYIPVDTLEAFQAAYNALVQIEQRSAHRARLKID